MPKKLQLNKETLRHLSETDLSEVSGGASTIKCGGVITQTMACPSGATWLQECASYNGYTCS